MRKSFQLVRVLAQAIGLTFIYATVFFAQPAVAQSPEVYVPPALESWSKWVLERTPELACPTMQSSRNCQWPGRLQLKATAAGATFRYIVAIDKRGVLALPGDQTIWPIDVQIAASKATGAVVVDSNGAPAVRLEVGGYEISGRFAWQALPKSVKVPAEVGLVELSVEGKSIDRPKVGPGGELWLQQENVVEAAEENSLRVEVSRKLTDGLPFEITSQLQLRIAGKPRELVFPGILLQGSTPLRIESDLSYKLDERGVLTLQGRPGAYAVTIHAVLSAPPTSLQAPQVEIKGWAENEYWAWEAKEILRSVELRGASAIEPERTTLPEEWKKFPAYVVGDDTKLEFVETRRGEHELLPNQISLRRHLWLDISGAGYTVQDSLAGTINQAWRLNMRPGFNLGRAVVSGQDLLITEDVQSKLPGIELRQQNLSLIAEARAEGKLSELPAIGWDHDVTALSWVLSVPPGWRLLDASGPDQASGSWLSWWRLWDLFFISLFAVASAKLLGGKWGIAAFLLMVLCHGEPGAPRYAWVNLLAVVALLRVIPEGTFRRWLRYYFGLSAVFIGVVGLPFIVFQVRNALFPQLAQLGSPYRIHPEVIAGITLVVVGLSAFVGFVLSIARRQYRNAFLIVVVSPVVMMIMGSILFGAASTSGYNAIPEPEMAMQQMVPQAPAPLPLGKAGADLEASSDEYFGSGSNVLEEVLDAPSKAASSRGYKRKFKEMKQALVQNDPNAVVQTGVGIPNWTWRDYYLQWNGPVQKDRQVSLYLIGPRINLVFALLRVVLLLVFFLAIVDVRKLRNVLQTTAVVVIGLFVVQPTDAFAQSYPSEELLNELLTRLTSEHCQENCLVPSALRFELQCRAGDPGNELRIEAVVHSNGASSWPIPGPVEQFVPTTILVDQTTTDALRRDESGVVWVRIPAGTHRVEVKGKLRSMDAVTLQFGVRPRHVEVCTSNFTVDGLSPTGSVDDSIQFVRSAESRGKNTAAEQNGSDSEAPLGDWFLVRREITVGLPWTANTTVTRMGSNERAQLVKVPTFAGESVEDARFKVEGANVMVSFARGEQVVSWTSGVHEQPEIGLTAATGQPLTEVWRLRCASVWRCSSEGIAPTHSNEDGEQLSEWAPWPGEKLQIQIRRPLGVPGPVETVDQVKLDWVPGLGLMSAELSVVLRSGQAGWRKITLPADTAVQEVKINGAKRNLLPEKGVLTLPVVPGSQTYHVRWQQPWEQGALARMPAVDIGGPSTNAVVTIKVPERRWLLWLGGPGWGPAVLFWGAFLVMLVLAVIASRLAIAPLTTAEWIFLGLGLTVHHPLLLLLPAAWFYAHQQRRNIETTSRWRFNVMQIFLVLFSLFVFGVFLISIYRGLIISPDTGVMGGSSTNSLLRWYVDRQDGTLPTPFFVSVPLWVFRILMLAWSCWLVSAMLRWLRWGWECFSVGGLWRAK